MRVPQTLVCFLQHQSGVRLESSRVFGLDVMRASAISLVLLNHVALFFPQAGSFFEIGLLAGYLGVELFFVLSGFLIGGILFRTFENESSARSLANFWQRRWLRTLPNYFLFLVLNVLLAGWLARGIPSVLPYLFFFQNVTARPQPFFVESWSLAVEEWFYILVPVLFLVAIKVSRKSFRISSLFIIGLGILAVTAARSLYVLATHPLWLTDVRMIVVYRLDACMFGVLAAWMKHYHPEQWQRTPRVLFLAGVALLVGVASLPFLLPTDSLFPHSIGFTFTSVGALLLLPSLDRWTFTHAGGSFAVLKISLWSYSIYLVNLPVHSALNHLLPQASPFFLAAAFLFFSIALSALIYRCYEKPIMNLRRRTAVRSVDFALDNAAPMMAKN